MPEQDKRLLNSLDSLPVLNRTENCAAFGCLPEDFSEQGYLGCPDTLFRRLQRPWLWTGDTPQIVRRAKTFFYAKQLDLPKIAEANSSSDGSTKCVLQTSDGQRIEAVSMPRKVRNPRVTFCISSQVGCAMDCSFCATGKMGLIRNLSSGEIVSQVLVLMRAFGPAQSSQINLVFMGMGEPLHNLDSVKRAIKVLCHPYGLGISSKRITVSTCGLAPQIHKMAKWNPRPLLAVSLNGSTDEKRSEVMPIGRSHDLQSLKDALMAWPLRRREKITLEYVLLAGQNDSWDDAQRLASFARDFPHLVNLIPMNPHPYSCLFPPPPDDIRAFARRLSADGIFTVIRNNRAQDVSGACGQLSQKPRSDFAFSC